MLCQINTIEGCMFSKCTSLKHFEIPLKSFTSIGENAFYGCKSITKTEKKE